MNLYNFYGYIHGERVVGIVKAENENEALEQLRIVYDDYDSWTDRELTLIDFDNTGVFECFYG